MDINQSIKCTVDSCQYNQDQRHYCTLQQIQVGTHEQHPTVDECTDCQSFKVK